MKTRMPVSEARALLAWAEEKNPGPWGDHSRVAADAARVIGEACGLDGESAYVYGLLHDIGRYVGVTDLQHVYTGYVLLREMGYDDVAQICLTHSFPSRDILEYAGKNDLSEEQTAEVIQEIQQRPYSDYDALIQMADSLCLPTGICLMEKRLVDVVRRHGMNDRTLKAWDARFAILDHFNGILGRSIYSLFPEVVKNTFGTAL